MTDWNVSAAAAALHRDALVWDMTLPWRDYGAPELRLGTLPRMVAHGVDFISLTLAADWSGVAETTHKIAKERAWFQAHGDRYVLVEGVDEIERAQREGKLAVGFHFQGTNPVNCDVNLIEAYYKLGVRHMLLAYNSRNATGDGCNERTDGGLSRFGISVVEQMNRVGMLIDGTHCGYRTTMELFESSRDPVIFCHVNAGALWEHRRNVRDDQIEACAASGGVVGVSGVGIFPGDNDVSTARLVEHIDHIAGLVGPDHVGLGLDYVYDQDALTRAHNSRPAWNPDAAAFGNTRREDVRCFPPEHLPRLTEALLARHYTEAEIRGILGENWMRVARRVWR